MDAEKITEIAEQYKRILKLLKEPPQIMDDYDRCARDKSKILRHLHYLLCKLNELLSDGQLEKSFHWLGFSQGCFFALGLRSLNDLENDNKPREDSNQLWLKFD